MNCFIFLQRDSTQAEIHAYLLSQRTEWHFSPERAPHFGGLWEAAVKSAKFHLKRVIGSQQLDFEEFATVTAQVESCLNSRPLLQLNSHLDDGISALTPGHFLIGRPLRAYPETTISTSTSLLRRWTLCQNLVQHFWQRWSSEYLQQLQRMQKWRQPQRNLQPGDIVIIREDTPFTNNWPLAKVITTYPGRDGKVRVAQLKTANTVLKRPIAKLALILHEDDPSTMDIRKDYSSFRGENVRVSSLLQEEGKQGGPPLPEGT